MKDTDIIKAVAELDGFEVITGEITRYKRGRLNLGAASMYDYLYSRDAIVSVIEKWLKGKPVDEQTLFLDFLSCIVGTEREDWKMALNQILATPAQLCEALLRATGKWIE